MGHLQYFTHADKLAFEEEPNYDFLIGLFQGMINKYCSSVPYDFDWKKNVCTHLSAEQEQLNSPNTRSRDVSLIVNKNGTSTMNESRNLPEKANEEEEDKNEGENECEDSLDGGKNKIIITSPSKKKKRIKKKRIEK